MRRSKHQFRPDPLEVFETRIVPTVVGIDTIPFVPPGQINPANSSAPHLTVTSNFTVAGNTNVINTPSVHNNDLLHDHYVTIAYYTAPGGGNGNNVPGSGSGPSENLRSQSLLLGGASTTYLVPKGQTIQLPSYDASLFDQQGPDSKGNHFTGDDEFQCELFEAPDKNGYAPNKLNYDALDGHLVVGHLFQFIDDSSSNGKKK